MWEAVRWTCTHSNRQQFLGEWADLVRSRGRILSFRTEVSGYTSLGGKQSRRLVGDR